MQKNEVTTPYLALDPKTTATSKTKFNFQGRNTHLQCSTNYRAGGVMIPLPGQIQHPLHGNPLFFMNTWTTIPF